MVSIYNTIYIFDIIYFNMPWCYKYYRWYQKYRWYRIEKYLWTSTPKQFNQQIQKKIPKLRLGPVGGHQAQDLGAVTGVEPRKVRELVPGSCGMLWMGNRISLGEMAFVDISMISQWYPQKPWYIYIYIHDNDI
jgi:hypothetical protein